MNSALVKLLGNPGHFKLTGEARNKVKVHPKDKLCLLVEAGEVINLKDGEPIEEGIIQANQTVLVKPNVPLVPSKYHALVSYNPELALSGIFVTPVTSIVRPGEENNIALLVRVSKKTNLTQFGHVFELYQID